MRARVSPISVDRQGIHASSPSLCRGQTRIPRARARERCGKRGRKGGGREGGKWRKREREREKEREGKDEGGEGERDPTRLTHHGLFLYSIDFSKSSWWESLWQSVARELDGPVNVYVRACMYT